MKGKVVKKTIKCKIHGLTNIKKQILTDEYNKYQKICQEISEVVNNDYLPDRPFKMFKTPDRYCAYVLGAIKIMSKKKQFDKLNKQPLYLVNNKFSVIENQTKISKHWLKLPTKQKRGGIWLPIIIPRKYEDLLNLKICDSKITKNKNNWFLNLVVRKEVELQKSYSNIITMDLGERVIATVCGSFDNHRPTFYGRDIRGIRRHYAWLRKRLGKKKLLKVIKRIEHTEQRKVKDRLFKIARHINNLAEETDSVIVLGNLKGIRKSAKGRQMNRIVSHMPYYKLTEMITHMANWNGRQVIKVNERGTSHTCSKCGSEGKRPYQGLFKCLSCGYQANADYNGAKNILKRSGEYISFDGVEPIQPLILQGVSYAH